MKVKTITDIGSFLLITCNFLFNYFATRYMLCESIGGGMTNREKSREKYKAQYKIFANLYGVGHIKTLWYLFLWQPYVFPFKAISRLIKQAIYLTRFFIVCCWHKILLVKAVKSYESTTIVQDIIKPIALYLPQFHTIVENDAWWGKGFTEWTNVKKAQPLFDGHYQPHEPHGDIGYYDLSDVDVMRRQAQMAKKYGVYGFCFYYYYFKDGKRLLEKPINNWLQAKEIDFPFCFSWANENWTRAWDGGEKEIIMPQDYDESNMLNMLNEMLPAFHDDRYIKVDNKPLLLIYRAEIIPQMREVAEKWRRQAAVSGFDGLYLVSMQNFAQKSPYEMGLDAAAEFAPQPGTALFCPEVSKILSRADMPLSLEVTSYRGVINHFKNTVLTGYPRFSCVCPSWDNTPRRGEKGRVVLGSSPENFKKFLHGAICRTLLSSTSQQAKFLFINAWNEWGEGAHLEPDKKYGYQYLEKLQEAMSIPLKKL